MPSMEGRFGKKLIVWGWTGGISTPGEIQITMRGPSRTLDWDDRFDAATALRFFTEAAAEIAKLLHPPPAPPAPPSAPITNAAPTTVNTPP